MSARARAARRRFCARLCALLCACAVPGEQPESARRSDVATAAGGASAADDRGSRASSKRTTRATSQSGREACVVAAVSDGDSFRCAAQGRVRLLLLDAPESDQVPFGTHARDALRRRLVRGDTVWLEFDVQHEDRYNRTLAHVWSASSGGTHHNLAHARDGWAVAVVFPPNVRYIDEIRAAVADARRNRRGLWADGAFTCEPIAHKRGDC
jgi:endonuclease YncB( thermonuclease family)